MKRLARIPGLKIWSLLLFLAGSLGSCDVLEEEEEDCAVYVRFKYDMNMEFTDAFQHAVNSVTLYAFDKDGVLAYQKTEEGELLKQDNYRMRLDGISHSNKAEYDFITWAGDADRDESFIIPMLTVGQSTKEDLIYQLKRAGGGIVNDDLKELFHGQVENLSFGRAAAASKMEEVLVPLTKNTNSIRIILQQVSGKPISVDDFRFTITDKNGKMNFDNSIMEDEMLTYEAWHTGDGNAELENGQVQQEGVTSINVAIAELSTVRLMDELEPILTITTVEGEQVLSIPLVDCALLYKREKYSSMPNQEYLDREDEYNFTFFLDENNNWISSSIIINSWRVVLQNSDLN